MLAGLVLRRERLRATVVEALCETLDSMKEMLYEVRYLKSSEDMIIFQVHGTIA